MIVSDNGAVRKRLDNRLVRRARKVAARLVLGLPLLIAAGPALGQSVTAVPHLDMKRFVGVWYEIARVPTKLEKRCMRDAVAIYTVGDKKQRFALVNSCKGKDDSIETRNGNGKPQDKLGDGELKVAYTWPFYQKQWVLATGAEYEWALVGSPNHKALWLLGRTATMQPEVLAAAKAKAAAEGFDVSKLLMTTQTQ